MRFTRTLLCGATALALVAGPALAQPAPDQHQYQSGGMMGPGGQQPNHESDHGAMAPGRSQDNHGQMGDMSHQDQHGPMGPGNMDHQDNGGDHGPGGQQSYHESQHGAMGPGNMDHQDNHSSGQDHRWSRGQRYDGHRYVVNHGDWDRDHLHAPPHGYEWVRSGNEYILIAITSGIIASVIAGSASGY